MFAKPTNLAILKDEYDKKLQAVNNHAELIMPTKELWRLFVEGKAQQSGKDIKAYFKGDIPNCSIKTFAEYENNADWRASSFINFLKSKNWHLTDDQCDMLISDFLKLDQAWLQYENEAGYLAALYQVYPDIFDFNATLNAKFIMRLHESAINQVKGTAYSDDKDAYHFRKSPVGGMALVPDNHTNAGIIEFLQRNKTSKLDNKLYFNIIIYDLKSIKLGGLDLSPPSIEALRHFVEMKTDDAWEDFLVVSCRLFDIKQEKKLKDYLTSNKTISNFLAVLGKTKNDEEVAECFSTEIRRQYELYEGIINRIYDPNFTYTFYLASLQSDKQLSVSVVLTREINNLFAQYLEKNDKAALNFHLKLAAIVDLIQDLHQLHPFSDGNGRTFCILLLNHLLMRNGLPPTIIHNTAIFSLYSRDEIISKVIEGMQATLDLLAGKNINNVNTESVLSELAAFPALARYKREFDEMVMNEDVRRSKKFSSRPSGAAGLE